MQFVIRLLFVAPNRDQLRLFAAAEAAWCFELVVLCDFTVILIYLSHNF